MAIRIRAVCNKWLKIHHQTKSVRFPSVIFVHLHKYAYTKTNICHECNQKVYRFIVYEEVTLNEKKNKLSRAAKALAKIESRSSEAHCTLCPPHRAHLDAIYLF